MLGLILMKAGSYAIHWVESARLFDLQRCFYSNYVRVSREVRVLSFVFSASIIVEFDRYV